MRLVYNKKSNKAPTFLRKSMPVITWMGRATRNPLAKLTPLLLTTSN